MVQPSDRWNPFRLVETLSFFGEVPFVGNFRWVQQMLGETANPQAPLAAAMQPERAVVLLAEAGAAAESLKHLLAGQGMTVRSQLLPEDSSLPAADLNRIVNVSAVVWKGVPDDEECLAAQVEDLKRLPVSEEYALFDFRGAETDILREIWGAVDDVVMGGASASGLGVLPGYARFSGHVSTANSGGFASVRTRNFEPPFNLQGWEGIRLVLRGDGQRYKVILRNSANWDSLAYGVSVDTVAEQWMGVDIPFAVLKATFRAKTQPTAPLFQPDGVCSWQLMLSKFEYDGEKNPHFRPGAFSLDVRSLGVYRTVAPPLLVVLASSSAQAEEHTQLLAPSGLPYRVLNQEDPECMTQLVQHLREALESREQPRSPS